MTAPPRERSDVEVLEKIADLVALAKQQRGITSCPKCAERETLIDCIAHLVSPYAGHTDVL
jgi:hypothetical protein